MGNTIDARGLICPQPLIMVKKDLATIQEGVVNVLVDNTTAVSNITAYAESMGYTAETVEQDGDYQVSVHKSRDAACSIMPEQGSVVVLINDDQFGGGDDEFGETLMKNFIFALTEVQPKPATMLFVNAGAYFTSEGSPVLGSLHKLAEAGVEILTCGACLDFYNLKDSLAVGTVSNMYVIAEKLMQASHVVKP